MSDKIVVEKYLPLVYGCAKKLFKGNEYREWDDLVGDGFLGLVRAAKKYNESDEHSASFPHFARFYVRGAMIDGIRLHNKAGTNSFHLESLDTLVDNVGYDKAEAKDSVRLLDEMIDLQGLLDSLPAVEFDSVVSAVTGTPASVVAQRHNVTPLQVYHLREKFRERTRIPAKRVKGYRGKTSPIRAIEGSFSSAH